MTKGNLPVSSFNYWWRQISFMVDLSTGLNALSARRCCPSVFKKQTKNKLECSLLLPQHSQEKPKSLCLNDCGLSTHFFSPPALLTLTQRPLDQIPFCKDSLSWKSMLLTCSHKDKQGSGLNSSVIYVLMSLTQFWFMFQGGVELCDFSCKCFPW